MNGNVLPDGKDNPLNVLLVDDSEADVKISVRAFDKASLINNVYLAGNGQECLDFLRHEGVFANEQDSPRPDIILMDISMPVMDGLKALEAIKNDPELKSIPVVMLTASGNDIDVRNSYENGANSFIQKPVDYEQFVRVVEEFNLYWHKVNKLPRHRS